jgi:hypothetical protein
MSRIYLIGTPSGDVRLVRADTRQQVLSHVAAQMFNISVASQNDLVKAITSGSSVEDYKEADQANFEFY